MQHGGQLGTLAFNRHTSRQRTLTTQHNGPCMNFKKRIIVKSFIAYGAVSLLLSGCQMLSYKEPSGDDTATIIFSSENAAVQPVICVPGQGFKSSIFSVARKSATNDTLKDLHEAMHKAEQVPIQVDASRHSARIGFIMQKKNNTGPRKICKVAAQLSVVAGQTYHATFTEASASCGVTLTDANGTSLEDAIITPYECQ